MEPQVPLSVGAIHRYALYLFVIKKVACKIILLHDGQYGIAALHRKHVLCALNDTDTFVCAHPYITIFIAGNAEHIARRQVAAAPGGLVSFPLIVGRIVYRRAVVKT